MTLKKDFGIEWIGEIPHSWLVKPLYAIGAQVRTRNSSGSNANLLSLSYGEIKKKNIDSADGLLPESFDTYQEIKPGDLVFRFTDLQNDKRSLRSAVSGFEGIITSAYLAFRPKSIDSKYLGYLMRFYDTTKVFYSMGSGLRQSLKYADVRRLPIIVPPIEEQISIADFLDAELSRIDVLMERNNMVSALIKERTRVAMRAAVTTGEYQVKRLKHVAKIDYGYPFSSEQFASEGPLGVVRQGDFFEPELKTYTSEKAPQSAIINSGDILVSLSGDFNCVKWQGGQAGLNQRCAVIRFDEAVIDSNWLKYSIEVGLDSVTQNNVSTTVSNMSTSELQNILVPTPEISVQRNVVVELNKKSDDFKKLSQLISAMNSNLADRRQALIAAAVTGKINVRGKN